MEIAIFFDLERISEFAEEIGVVDGVDKAKNIVIFVTFDMALADPDSRLLRIGIGMFPRIQPSMIFFFPDDQGEFPNAAVRR